MSEELPKDGKEVVVPATATTTKKPPPPLSVATAEKGISTEEETTTTTAVTGGKSTTSTKLYYCGLCSMEMMMMIPAITSSDSTSSLDPNSTVRLQPCGCLFCTHCWIDTLATRTSSGHKQQQLSCPNCRIPVETHTLYKRKTSSSSASSWNCCVVIKHDYRTQQTTTTQSTAAFEEVAAAATTTTTTAPQHPTTIPQPKAAVPAATKPQRKTTTTKAATCTRSQSATATASSEKAQQAVEAFPWRLRASRPLVKIGQTQKAGTKKTVVTDNNSPITDDAPIITDTPTTVVPKKSNNKKRAAAAPPPSLPAGGGDDDSTSTPNKKSKKPRNKYMRFEQRLEQLKSYKEEHGTCNVPVHYDEPPQHLGLARWVHSIKYGQCRVLIPDRRKQLDDLGFDWTKPEKRKNNHSSAFQRRLDELKIYLQVKHPDHQTTTTTQTEEASATSHPGGNDKEVGAGDDSNETTKNKEAEGNNNKIPGEGGNQYAETPDNNNNKKKDGRQLIRIPRNDPDFPDLAKWIWDIRYKKRSINSNQQAQINELGFELEPIKPRTSFDERIKQLQEFKQEHGHCVVPYKYHKNPSLGEWVKDIRRGHMKITKEQRKMINQIGFNWETKTNKNEREWNAQLEKVKQYKEKNGHCHIPWQWQEDKKLSEWCHTQKKLNRKNELRQDRKRALDEIGFSWSGKRNQKNNNASSSLEGGGNNKKEEGTLSTDEEKEDDNEGMVLQQEYHHRFAHHYPYATI